MRYVNKSKHVCRWCFDTGTRVLRIGRYYYGIRCSHTKQLEAV
jgi:hypothetical protein